MPPMREGACSKWCLRGAKPVWTMSRTESLIFVAAVLMAVAILWSA
jgi:hypothetical protein